MSEFTKLNAMNEILTLADASEDLKAWAQHQIELDEKAKAKAKEKRATTSPKRVENEATLREKILPILGVEPTTAGAIAEVLEISVPKATAILKIGVELGLVDRTDVKGKKGTVKGYFKA